MKFKVTKTPRLDQGNSESKREEIKQYLLDTIELEDSLYALLKDDKSFYERPNTLRHPLIFYFGHTFTFFINKLYIAKFIPKRLNPHLESMLAIGVDEMSWDDLNESHYDWPPVSIVQEYRDQVKDLLLDFIEQTELTMPIDWNSPFWPIIMGIEHQRIHIETSSVLIRELPLEFLNEKPTWPVCEESGKAPLNELLDISAAEISIGKDFKNSYYGWDNEYGGHQKKLDSFSASKYLVSNQEFLEFVEDGGYLDDNFWNLEGKKWKDFSKTTHPYFWRSCSKESAYSLRLIDREIALPLNWPVEVNQLEAKAFCLWKSHKEKCNIRLPLEDEWCRLYQSENVEHLGLWSKAPGNINLEHFASSCPVDRFKANRFYDVIGNVWQWTETPIYPFDGFKVHPFYDDFTVPTYDNKHNLIKGGSWISTGNEALPESRFAFRRHFFQHAGFRYVNSSNSATINDNPYETDSLLSQYCEFHFGETYFNTPNFPKACIKECSKYFEQLPQQKRALDLGCAVGRSTFELSHYFDHVTGLDFSARFIEVAQKYMDNGVLRYTIPIEGELFDYCERSFDSLECRDIQGRVEFFQGDACNLPSKYGQYDFIFCGNLIDRLRSPKSFLHSIEKHLNPGGLMVLTSPYTWLEEYTPKEEWIGGKKRDGENLDTLKGLDEELGPWFERIAEPVAVPFIIRETKRKYQHTLSEMTVWKKTK
jgi:5-histidylcysteine sulfoxide synthase/putative 4-mercaptohistidine N1-methyltranferase